MLVDNDGQLKLEAGRFRFITSPDLPSIQDGGAAAGSTGLYYTTSTSAIDVYPLIVTAQDAWSQIALRGVFAKVFSQKTPWNVTPEHLAKDPKFEGLAFTQFAIADGWLSAAMGLQRTAARSSELPR